MMKKISDYINTDPGEGWRRLAFVEEVAPDAISFGRGGLQVLASVRTSANKVPFVHFSIGLCPSMEPQLDKQEMLALVVREAPNIIRLFFGEVMYIPLPPDPRLPEMSHWAIKVEEPQ